MNGILTDELVADQMMSQLSIVSGQGGEDQGIPLHRFDLEAESGKEAR